MNHILRRFGEGEKNRTRDFFFYFISYSLWLRKERNIFWTFQSPPDCRQLRYFAFSIRFTPYWVLTPVSPMAEMNQRFGTSDCQHQVCNHQSEHTDSHTASSHAQFIPGAEPSLTTVIKEVQHLHLVAAQSACDRQGQEGSRSNLSYFCTEPTSFF